MKCPVCKQPESLHRKDDDFVPERAACESAHDPHPYVSSGIAMAQATFGSTRKFMPRDGFCAVEEHYVLKEDS